MSITEHDREFIGRAIELALEAEREGNLPIGAVITLDGEVVGEGKNRILSPEPAPNRHAEMEALRSVPSHLWARAREMTLYTTLEPCLMCLGATLLHWVGRIVFGAADNYGGAGCVIGHMSPYFENAISEVQWIGPVLPEECDQLFLRTLALVEKHRQTR